MPWVGNSVRGGLFEPKTGIDRFFDIFEGSPSHKNCSFRQAGVTRNNTKLALKLMRHLMVRQRTFAVGTSLLFFFQLFPVCWAQAPVASPSPKPYYSKTSPPPLDEELLLLFKQAASQQKAGNLETAARLYQQILLQNPRLAEVHNNLGLIFQAIGHLELAQQEYEESIRLVPDYVLALNNLASLLFASSQYEQAAGLWLKTIQKDPLEADYYYNLGLCSARMNQPKKGIGYLQLTLKLNPREISASLLLGQLMFSVGDYEGALKAYEQCLALVPDAADGRRGDFQRQITLINSILGPKKNEERIPSADVPAPTRRPAQSNSGKVSHQSWFRRFHAGLKSGICSLFSRRPHNRLQTQREATNPNPPQDNS